MSTSDSIDISVEHRGDVAVLTVSGVVDLATAPALEDVTDQLVAQKPRALVIDVSDVTFLASVGLKILASTHRELAPTGCFAVIADGPATGRPIKLTHLDEVFSLYSTLDDGLAAVRDELASR
ncbi:MAG TPA: STAS domain-containing protein [Mycobacterium sp.]|nr:STAS domain-containing protein [Mycobacterium sp.]